MPDDDGPKPLAEILASSFAPPDEDGYLGPSPMLPTFRRISDGIYARNDFYRDLLQRLLNAYEGVSIDDLAEAEAVMGGSIVGRSRRVELAETIRLARKAISGSLDILGELEPEEPDNAG